MLWRALHRVRETLRSRPKLALWLGLSPLPGAKDADYRKFNLSLFSRFAEQERMLADRPRMAFYHAAITHTVKPGDRVIDLGTGTGILAAFASRRGAGRVFAVDHSEILKHARRLAAHNKLENVEFISSHSRDFTTAEPVDVILHEQMGDFLFDEAMVANVIDLRDRLLKPGGLIVPAIFDFYCEPVMVRADRRVPFIWELNVHGYDYACLDRSRPQDPGYYRHNSSDLGVVDHFLGEPSPALALDLQTLREADLPREIRIRRTVVQEGTLDGLVVFFTARTGDLSLSSSPIDPGRAPHWGFRILRTESAFLSKGDVIEFTLSADEWSNPETWRWSQTQPA